MTWDSVWGFEWMIMFLTRMWICNMANMRANTVAWGDCIRNCIMKSSFTWSSHRPLSQDSLIGFWNEKKEMHKTTTSGKFVELMWDLELSSSSNLQRTVMTGGGEKLLGDVSHVIAVERWGPLVATRSMEHHRTGFNPTVVNHNYINK